MQMPRMALFLIVAFVFLAIPVVPAAAQESGGDISVTQTVDGTGFGDRQIPPQWPNKTEYTTTAGNITLSIQQYGRQGARTVNSPMLFDVVVENPSSGIAAYDFVVELNETTGAANTLFTDFSANKSGLVSTDIFDNGSRMEVGVAQLDNRYDPAEEIVIGQLTIVGDTPGDVVIDPTEASVMSNNTTQYNASLESASVAVIETLEPLPGAEGPPRDLTGDGLLEDVDGDGEVTLFDALALFDTRSSIGTENAKFFNFAGNNPDEVTLFDALTLFDERNARNP